MNAQDEQANLSNSKKVNIQTEEIAKILSKQIKKEIFMEKYAPAKEVLYLVAAGAFIGGSLVIPNLPLALKPFLVNKNKREAWKRFNIPYLRQTLKRLEKQRLVEIYEEGEMQVIKITNAGGKRILKGALDNLQVRRPRVWDGSWRLVCYDIPKNSKTIREIFRNYLERWGFYRLQESVFLHAFPCRKEVEFLREYLGIGEDVRIFEVSKIENDKVFRTFFGV